MPATTHMRVETVPPGLTVVDADGRPLGVAPFDMDTTLQKLSLRARVGDVLSTPHEIAVHEGTVVVDVSSELAPSRPAIAKKPVVPKKPVVAKKPARARPAKSPH
jgi:hypothetical protein